MEKEDKEAMLEFIVQNNITPTPELPPDALIACCLISQFDEKADREFWEMPINESVKTDYICDNCKEKVVMSRWTKNEYERNGKVNPISCMSCIIKDVVN